MLNEQLFKNPSSLFRPLQIAHSFETADAYCKYAKTEAVRKRLSELKSLGFGGIVTNVCLDNYLVDEENWDVFSETVKIAKEMGLRLWIYDEKGYPSGAAGGLTLEGHPEYEAQGVIGFFYKVEDGEMVEIVHPKGHGEVLLACVCKGDSFDSIDVLDSYDLSKYLDTEMNLSWRAPEGKWFVCYIVTKPLFEGTHAARNYFEIKRYVNLLDKDAVKRFIELTYEAYFKRVGQHFGNYIEAFFTDEPSLIPEYWPELPEGVHPTVVDEINLDMELYPTIAWHRDIFKEFKKRRGYELKPYMPYLFGGKSEKACQTRWDYRKTVSEMYEEAYFKQLHDFCSSHDIAFSGHVLYEQDLKMHTSLEGNFFSILRHMHFPGIDMLYATPERIMEKLIVVPKLISSIAHLYGRRHVMSETSAIFDEVIDKVKVNKDIMKCSIAMQYAMGVDTFTSYYSDSALPAEEYREFCDFTGRIGEVLAGGTHVAQVALYYPIETMNMFNLPSDKHITENEAENRRGFTREEMKCDEGWISIVYSLLNNQKDFDVIDSRGVISCKAENSKLITPMKESFDVLVIPPVRALEPDFLDKLNEAAAHGVKIIIMGECTPIGPSGTSSEELGRKYEALISMENVKTIETSEELINILNSMVEVDVMLEGYLPEIIYLHKRFCDEDIYLFVNTSKKCVDLKGSVTCKGNMEVWNPSTGDIEPITAQNAGNERSGFTLRLKGYEALMLVLRK